MSSNTLRLLAGVSAGAILIGFAGSAMAKDTQEVTELKAEVAELRQEVQELKAMVRDNRQVAVNAQETAAATQQMVADTKAVVETRVAVEDANTAAITTLNAAPKLGISNGRPTFTSADGRFSAAIRSVVMFDAAGYRQEDPSTPDNRRGGAAGDTARAKDLNDGTNFRRARLGVEGKVFGDWQYNVLLEMGGSGGEDATHLQEGWIQYNGFKGWQFRVGAFEPQVGLAANSSTSSMMIMERPAPAEVARNFAAGDSRSGVQALKYGSVGADAAISFDYIAAASITGGTVGVVNSSASGVAQPFDEQLGYNARLVVSPYSATNWRMHFGVNTSQIVTPADTTGGGGTRYPVQLRDRPELRVDGTRLIDTGGIDAEKAWAVGAEGGLQMGSFLVEGEYFKYGIERRNSAAADPRFSGWYVQGSWFLTGETRKWNPTSGAFDGPAPNFPFNKDAGTWGAWEIAARYSDLDLNFREGALGTAPGASTVRGGEQTIATVGLNWYVNNNIRFMLDVQKVKIDRLSPNAATFATATGVQVGQDYTAVGFRTQIGF